MKVLVACEFSGIVREAFAIKGHNAWSIDLLDTEIPGQHIIGNVLDYLSETWDLMIAHPPCTYLTNAGVRFLTETRPLKNGALYGENRRIAMCQAAVLFNSLLAANISHIAIENPIMHRYARELINVKYAQIIQPYEYGHRETKSTCLWLRNLPALVPTQMMDWYRPVVHYATPGIDRWKARSRTCRGIAAAMADQWGSL